MPELKQSIKVTLLVPVEVKGADGKPAMRSEITLRRPKVAEAKRMAALIGPSFFNALMGEDDLVTALKAKGDDVDMSKLIVDVVSRLFTTDGLDTLTGLVAAMSGEEPEVIDGIDWVDLPALGKAFLGFFPALQSIVPTGSPATSD